MSDLVPSDQIETIVGVLRHPTKHYARAISDEQTVYILHSHECRTTESDLRECDFSIALDRGIDAHEWIQDAPVLVGVVDGRLVPDLTEVTW